MKQKRKVKSLISPRSGSNVLLTVLLVLGGGVLFLGAVALFTSLGGVASAAGESAVLDYDNGIDDQVEVLLNLKFAQSGIVVNTVNEMEFSGNTFYIKGDKGISIETTAASIDSSKNVNYLGGEEDGVNIASNNVTIIGGGKAKIYQGNDNAAILGGISSRVVEGGNKEAPVMVGGNSNEITVNQEGSAIIGGNSNKIVNGGKYDFILGGDNNSVNGDNVIVGGANVNVAGKSHLFAFSDGRNLNPGGGNAFYLYVRNGLGLSKAAVNKGVDSNGAVKIGLVNINTSCMTEDVGVQGIWQVEAGGYGCLVGCTLASKNDHNKWEMMDHSDTCEGYCKNNEGRCMVKPIEPTPLTPYTSKCSVGGVDTSNSTQCAANRLDVYENVIFETYLIDSDDSCPSTDETNNRCVFKCDKDYHLTGNTAGGTSKTKCYADCTLPWNGEKIKHNERVDAYNAKTVACSNTDWVFPAATAIINVPTRGYPNTRTLNSMLKTTEAAGKSFESCTNYDHKKTLICNNGTLYIANGTRATSTKALGSTGAGNWYGYDTCTTRDYTCPTSIYNLKRSDITDTALDNPKPGTNWNDTDRGITQGVRGQYELCQDWTPSVGNSECKVGLNGNNGTIDNNYHYQLVRCQQGYSTGTDNNPYECKQSCYLSGTSIEFKHNMGVTGYKHDSRTCTDICDDEWIVCNDGKWRVGTKDGTPTTDYHYYNCVLNDKVCANNFDVKQTEKDEGLRLWGDHSVYATACVPYSGNGKFQCDEKPKLYDLINCNPYPGYHTENNKYCRDDDDEAWCKHQGASVTKNFSYIDKKVPIEWINSTSYNNGKWSTPANCAWKCNSDSHMENGDCEKDAKLVRCDDTWVPSTANATMVRVRVYWQPSAEDYTSADACAYTCKPGYEGSDCETACHDVVCPADEYPFTSATCPEHGICGSSCTPQSADCSKGSSVVKLTSCVGDYHISSDGRSCEPNDDPCEDYTLSACPDGWVCEQCTNGKYKKNGCDTANGYHQSGTSCVKDTIYCTQSGGPTHSHYINIDEPIAAAGNCDWECDCGYYENSTATACLSCPSGQYSTEGSTSCSTCPSGQQPNSSQCGCVNVSCTPSKTCATYGLSDSPSGSCSQAYTKSDGCSDSLTCYGNGCAVNGYDGYNCYPYSQDFEADAAACTNAGNNFDIHALSPHGYCAKCDGNVGTISCTSPCGHGVISAGSTDTCYSDGNPACSSTSNPCDSNYQQRTCGADGKWSSPWGSSYIYGSCTPKASGSCSEVEYPFETPTASNVKSWNTPCVYYAANSCEEKKRYSIKECITGYHISSNGESCEPNDDPCEDYTLSACPDGWICEQCTNGKYKKKCDNRCSGSLYTECPYGYKVKQSAYTNSCGNTCYQCEVDPEIDVCPDGYNTWTTSLSNCIGISCSEYGSDAWSISTTTTPITHTVCGKCVPKDPCTNGYTISTNDYRFNLNDCKICGCARSAYAGMAMCDCAAPNGYTRGTPPTNDCYNYTTTTKCGDSYYARGTYKCSSNQECNNGTCEDKEGCAVGEVDVTYTQTQMYQDPYGDWQCGSDSSSINGYCCDGGSYHGKDTNGCTKRDTSEGTICAYRD